LVGHSLSEMLFPFNLLLSIDLYVVLSLIQGTSRSQVSQAQWRFSNTQLVLVFLRLQVALEPQRLAKVAGDLRSWNEEDGDHQFHGQGTFHRFQRRISAASWAKSPRIQLWTNMQTQENLLSINVVSFWLLDAVSIQQWYSQISNWSMYEWCTDGEFWAKSRNKSSNPKNNEKFLLFFGPILWFYYSLTLRSCLYIGSFSTKLPLTTTRRYKYITHQRGREWDPSRPACSIPRLLALPQIPGAHRSGYLNQRIRLVCANPKRQTVSSAGETGKNKVNG